MWRQVPWVADGMTVQGGLELVFAVVLLIVGVDSDTKPPETLYQKMLMGIGPLILLCGGGLKTFAASRNRRYRNRQLGLVALSLGVATAMVWLCAPTGLALLVYGSFVYRHPASRRAFEMGSQGRTLAEITASLAQSTSSVNA